MTKSLEDLGDIARRAVELAAELVRTSTPHQITEKSDRDTVTDVDVKVEQEVRAFLSRETPGYGFLGEEEGQVGDEVNMWTLDPIDGTSNFAHGLPLCAVSLALVREGWPIVAEITAPLLGLRYSAIRGEGAFANSTRMHASRTAELSKAIVSIGDYAVGEGAKAKNERRLRLTALLAERVERVRMFGSAAIDLAWVAEGRTDATVMLANKPWDTAAGVLIAREAGALAFDSAGDPHTPRSSATIVAAAGIADAVASVVQQAPGQTV
ncbi:MAG TPA: inositol monophosphatase family protein [Pseudonocardiaceae bacterium]|nr:inositol monophosphatase family protein [Pseudonocardiaceae bacterium]